MSRTVEFLLELSLSKDRSKTLEKYEKWFIMLYDIFGEFIPMISEPSGCHSNLPIPDSHCVKEILNLFHEYCTIIDHSYLIYMSAINHGCHQGMSDKLISNIKEYCPSN